MCISLYPYYINLEYQFVTCQSLENKNMCVVFWIDEYSRLSTFLDEKSRY